MGSPITYSSADFLVSHALSESNVPVLAPQPRRHRQLLQILLGDIASGKAATGELLAREADLAIEYGVSRGVVREALRGLEDRGLVTVRHGHGAIVEAEDRWNLLDSDVLAATLVGPNRVRALSHMLEVRRIIEVEAAGLAAQRTTPETLAPIAAALEQMQAMAEVPVDPREEDAFLIADVAFHEAVIDATENPMLMKMAEPLQQSLLEARRPLVHPEDRLRVAVPGQRALVDAIAARDVATAQRAAGDILSTVESYLRQYEAESAALISA
jgi:GntR family transcriptional repressor for pyruvate dehydrogenase complex